MLPKSSKHYIVPTAEALGFDVDKVERVISFYYATLRNALVEMKCHNIQVEKLGTFRARWGEVKKLLEKYERHLNVTTSDTLQQMSIRKDVERRLRNTRALQSMIDADRERKKKHLEKKYGKTRNDMAK